jgi:hypothetical protein
MVITENWNGEFDEDWDGEYYEEWRENFKEEQEIFDKNNPILDDDDDNIYDDHLYDDYTYDIDDKNYNDDIIVIKYINYFKIYNCDIEKEIQKIEKELKELEDYFYKMEMYEKYIKVILSNDIADVNNLILKQLM